MQLTNPTIEHCRQLADQSASLLDRLCQQVNDDQTRQQLERLEVLLMRLSWCLCRE